MLPSDFYELLEIGKHMKIKIKGHVVLPKGEFFFLELTPVASWLVYTASVIYGQYTNSHSYFITGACWFPWLTGGIVK